MFSLKAKMKNDANSSHSFPDWRGSEAKKNANVVAAVVIRLPHKLRYEGSKSSLIQQLVTRDKRVIRM